MTFKIGVSQFFEQSKTKNGNEINNIQISHHIFFGKKY